MKLRLQFQENSLTALSYLFVAEMCGSSVNSAIWYSGVKQNCHKTGQNRDIPLDLHQKRQEGDISMNFKTLIFSFVLLGLALPVAGEEAPECYTHKYDSEQLSAERLRKIAEKCPLTPVANLYYNRAYHIDLINHHAGKSRLQNIVLDRSERFERVLEAYRVYIALVETFATHTNTEVTVLIEALNQGYEDAIELAELRFLGYDRRADWLEWYRTLPPELRKKR